MRTTPSIVLTIAGFDPSSGAGVTADIKTIAAHSCYGVACITALTVQSTRGVSRIAPVKPDLLAESLEELAGDVDISAVHIGMLGSEAIAQVVADFLSARRPPNIVLDPILKATSGAELLSPEGLVVMIRRLIPLASVITPNLEEASIISGLEVKTRVQMEAVARNLHKLGAQAVIITGGVMDEPTDLLSQIGKAAVQQKFFDNQRVPSNSTHGTGCAFSVALACHLAHGRTLADAVPQSQAYVWGAIKHAYAVGGGTGPMNHLYRLPDE